LGNPGCPVACSATVAEFSSLAVPERSSDGFSAVVVAISAREAASAMGKLSGLLPGVSVGSSLAVSGS
jgi:hypothetical protein